MSFSMYNEILLLFSTHPYPSPLHSILASSTYTRVKQSYVEYTRMCHRTNKHITRVSHTWEHIHRHTSPHTCEPGGVGQCTTHMHNHATCATPTTLTLSSTSCTKCLRTTHKYPHRHVPPAANASCLVFNFVDSTCPAAGTR